MALDVAAEPACSLDACNDPAAFRRDALTFEQIDPGIREPRVFALCGGGQVRTIKRIIVRKYLTTKS